MPAKTLATVGLEGKVEDINRGGPYCQIGGREGDALVAGNSAYLGLRSRRSARQTAPVLPDDQLAVMVEEGSICDRRDFLLGLARP
jgi:hypothetical protein